MIDVIHRKLGSLPKESRRLLDVIAVAGQSFSIEDALTASGESVNQTTINSMGAEKLIRRVGAQEDKVDTYHDRMRETVLANMNAEVRRKTHLDLATTLQRRHGLESLSLERDNTPQPTVPTLLLCTLAGHFDQAVEHARALVFGVVTSMLLGRYADAAEKLRSAIDLWRPNSADFWYLWLQSPSATRVGQVPQPRSTPVPRRQTLEQLSESPVSLMPDDLSAFR